MGNTISLCMITRNAEHLIDTALRSVKDSVDEMIVVDTGSTDKTKSIAMSYGAKIYDLVWVDDFAAARNFSIDQATMDWILMLDEDHELLLTKGLSLKDEIARYPQDLVFRMNIVQEGKSDYPYIRIWRNGYDLHFVRPVHETHDFENSRMNVDTSLIRTLETKVIHHHKAKSESYRSERNFRLLSDAVQKYPDDHLYYYYLGAEYNARQDPHQAISCFITAIAPYQKQDRELVYKSRFSIPPYVYANLIATFGLIGDHKRALLVYDEASAIFPDFRELHYIAGVINMEIKNYHQAIEHFSRSLERATNSGDYLEKTDIDIRALSEAGDAYRMLGLLDEAKRVYFETLKKSPDDEKTQKNLLRLLASGFNKDTVMTEINNALTEVPISFKRMIDQYFVDKS